jgi:hypothetical protein
MERNYMNVSDLRKALDGLPDDMLVMRDGMTVTHLQQVWIDQGYYGNKQFFMLGTGSDSIIYYEE